MSKFYFAILFLTLLLFTQGCGNSSGWMNDYLGKDYILQGRIPDISSSKIKLTFEKIEKEKNYYSIALKGEVLEFISENYYADAFNRLEVKAKDIDGINVDASFHMNANAKKGEKFRGDIAIVTPDISKISEIKISIKYNPDEGDEKNNEVLILRNIQK